jgi:hypothetical protein
MSEITIEVVETRRAPVRYLRAECAVRYWEDAKVNGVEDTDGKLIPLRNGEDWDVTIDLATGKIEGWPQGTTADIHYKVCDAGRYSLLDADRNVVRSIDGYVPKIMAPGDEDHGFGDYVIMKVSEDGTIDKWKVDLAKFSASGDDE